MTTGAYAIGWMATWLRTARRERACDDFVRTQFLFATFRWSVIPVQAADSLPWIFELQFYCLRGRDYALAM
jgi:hypothetical protein